MNVQQFKNVIKIIFYQVAKWLGLFHLALKITGKESRILCYHGGSIQEEHLVQPGVFISKPVFKQHLQLIDKYRFSVLNLNELIKKATQNNLPSKSLVLTFDDGFYNTQQIIEPLLKQANYKATLYVTTYYVTHQSPIFPLALSYLFYKSKKEQVELILPDNLHHTFATKGNKAFQSIKTIYNYSKTLSDNEQNQLIKTIGSQLEVNTDSIFKERLFHNLNPVELKAMHERGTLDIQLHTHRHNLPIDNGSEIEKNRSIISSITGKEENTLVHFCYPSGIWKPEHHNLLRKLGIQSATTLDYGLNNNETNVLSLKRIHCSNNTPLIVFEAKLTGFDILLRRSIKTMVNKMKQLLNVNRSLPQD